jgi:hypothetical protein
MAKYALILAGSTIAMIILGYVFYTVFFPLIRTVAGGLQILSTYGSRKSRITDRDKSPAFLAVDPELGPTMADGGEKTKKQD